MGKVIKPVRRGYRSAVISMEQRWSKGYWVVIQRREGRKKNRESVWVGRKKG